MFFSDRRHSGYFSTAFQCLVWFCWPYMVYRQQSKNSNFNLKIRSESLLAWWGSFLVSSIFVCEPYAMSWILQTFKVCIRTIRNRLSLSRSSMKSNLEFLGNLEFGPSQVRAISPVCHRKRNGVCMALQSVQHTTTGHAYGDRIPSKHSSRCGNWTQHNVYHDPIWVGQRR